MPEVGKKVKLVNRGAAGLLTKVVVPDGLKQQQTDTLPLPGGKNKITAGLKGLAVDIHSLKTDPDNCRTHPERNIEAIKASLQLYGQTKPVVVRKQGRVIAAGNGTYTAALALGWTRIAANVMPMTDVEFAGYALADNRTAELAGWDFEAVARAEAILREASIAPVGWSNEELLAIRGQLTATAPDAFPEVDETIEIEHVCPKCGYQFSGGQTVPAKGNG